MNYKEDFVKYIEYTIQKDRLQFYCYHCLINKNCPEPEPMYENTGYCNNCGSYSEVSNPYLNAWLKHNGFTFDQRKINSGLELRDHIPWQLANIEILYKSTEI